MNDKTPKATPKATTKATTKAKPKVAPKATTKAKPKATPKVTPKATPKAKPKAAPKIKPEPTSKAAPKDTPTPGWEATYDRYTAKLLDLYQNMPERSHKALEEAKRLTLAQMEAAGEFTNEQGKKLQGYLERDTAVATDFMKKMGEGAKEKLHPSRLGAGALSALATFLSATGETIQALSRETERALIYRTGEVTSLGTLTCLKCGHVHIMQQTGTVPPCPVCGDSQFKKGY